MDENRENWKSSSSDAKVERKKRDDKDTTNTFVSVNFQNKYGPVNEIPLPSI